MSGPTVAFVRLIEFAVTVEVPPQTEPDPGWIATSPGGSVSVTETPVSVVVAFGLATSTVATVVPFSGIVDTWNRLAAVGGWGGGCTTSDALAAVPVNPSLVVNSLVVLVLVPAVTPVTVIVTVQLLEARIVPILNANVEGFDPSRPTLPDPHVWEAVSSDVISPAGSGSVNATSFRSAAFGLVSVKVRLVEEPTVIGDVPNALVIVGGLPTTSLAVAGSPVPTVSADAAAVLSLGPRVVP